MSTSLLSLPLTSLQTSVSVVLVPTTVFAQKIYTVPETLLSISSFVHKYPNVNIIAIIASDFTSNFGFCGLGAYHSFCIVIFVYPGNCYLHMIIMHKTVIVSVIKAITVLCKCNSAQDSTLHTSGRSDTAIELSSE